MRTAVREYLREALISVALFGSIGVAMAQAPAGDKDNANQPSSIPDQNGKQEPSAKGASPNDPAPPKNTTSTAPDIFVNGKLNVPGAPANTDTTPAKFSEENDRFDKTPIMALGPALSDEQRKAIWEKVTADKRAPATVTASPAMALPITVELHDWPQDIAQIPGMQNFKYVRTQDKILLVRPENRIVVEEIAK